MAASMDRLRGWVKWFDSRRGFGFITPAGGGQDIFVHQSSIVSAGFRSLTAGETVEFVVSVNDEGRSSAVSVTGFGDCNYGIPCYGFLATQPTSLWNPLKLESLPPLPAKCETLVDQVSEEQIEVISEAEWRNWADLPGDILSIIFKKITAADIILSAQFVCKPWRSLSLEPSLWRCIELRMDKRLDNMVSLAMMAVDRSEGFVEELYMESFPTDELMHYIADRATRLRGLHLIEAFINEEAFVDALRKLPLLEELEMSLCSCFSYEIVERIGKTCPQLKSFRFNGPAPTSIQFYRRSNSRRDTAALAIAKHFKLLRRLQLFANCLTSTGLSAILDNCPDLESLDIRYCFNVSSLDESLKKKCARIKDLRLPNDSTADYENGVGELQTDYSYINPHLYVAYFDFGYCDDEYCSYFDYYGFYDMINYDGHELF